MTGVHKFFQRYAAGNELTISRVYVTVTRDNRVPAFSRDLHTHLRIEVDGVQNASFFDANLRVPYFTSLSLLIPMFSASYILHISNLTLYRTLVHYLF